MEWISFSAPMRILTVSARAKPLRRIAGAVRAPISACLRDRRSVVFLVEVAPVADGMRVFMVMPALFLITSPDVRSLTGQQTRRRVYAIRA